MFGFTIDWRTVLWWLLTVVVLQLLFELVKYYFVKTSDHQLAKYFSWWKRNQDEEDELLEQVVTRVLKHRDFTEQTVTRTTGYVSYLVAVTSMIVVLGQIVLSLATIDSFFRTLILVVLFIVLLLLSIVPIKTHRWNKKVDTMIIARQQQSIKHLTQVIEKHKFELDILKRLEKEGRLQPNQDMLMTVLNAFGKAENRLQPGQDVIELVIDELISIKTNPNPTPTK